MDGYFYNTEVTDPCINLATEEYLVRLNEELQSAILYLWQNSDTVVIGRNQNAYAECDLDYAARNGIRIVRRLSGGGAVYHDLGNINYSMILPVRFHDIRRSTRVILNALKSLGIEADACGRNDICTRGHKISGNAYYFNDKVGLHHGTILYNADKERMEAVLNVSETKLKSHGIASVRARVTDIVSVYPDIGMEELRLAIKDSFREMYITGDFSELRISDEDIMVFRDRYRSTEWNLDKVTDSEGTDEI